MRQERIDHLSTKFEERWRRSGCLCDSGDAPNTTKELHMTVATAKPFNMDEQGFLQTIDRLLERFNQYTSDRCCENVERARNEQDAGKSIPPFDDVVHELAGELFGGTSWPINLDMDMIMLDRFQIGYDSEFLISCRNVVHKYGMSVWLYEMINDASIALATKRPSNRMPFQLGLFDTREVLQKKTLKGVKHGSVKRRQHECMEEYLRQTYRLSAYSLLRWGNGDSRAADTALMLLAYGGLGMCMLREDPKVVSLGCDPDFRYRHVCDQLRDMRIKADLDYVCSIDLSVTGSLEYPSCVDARYLYDANRIVKAYRTLWNEPTKSAAQLLAETEKDGPYEVTDIWTDPLYLHDLALSLLGPEASYPLEEGFRLRDRAMFEKGVEELGRQADNVRKAGLLLTLAGYIFFASPERHLDTMLASRRNRKRMLDSYEKLGEMATIIALYRLPRDSGSLRAARALLMHETGVYADEMGKYMGLAGEPNEGKEETSPTVK